MRTGGKTATSSSKIFLFLLSKDVSCGHPMDKFLNVSMSIQRFASISARCATLSRASLHDFRRYHYPLNRVLRGIFGPKRDEVTREWRKLHNEEFNDLYSSPNIVRVIKSRRMRWKRHVERMGRGEAYTGFWWGDLRETDHFGGPGVDGRIILRWIFRKWGLGCGLDRGGSG